MLQVTRLVVLQEGIPVLSSLKKTEVHFIAGDKAECSSMLLKKCQYPPALKMTGSLLK